MPRLWAIGCLVQLAIGVSTVAIIAKTTATRPPLHDTFFVGAHLHWVLQLAVAFGFFAGLYYLFPRVTGYRYYEPLGRIHFWLLFIGANTMLAAQVLVVARAAERLAEAPHTFNYWNLVFRFGSYVAVVDTVVLFVNMVLSLLRKRSDD